MDNIQAAIVNPSPVTAKVAAAEAAVDAEGAQSPGAFLAMLSHQVKTLQRIPGLDAQATDAKASDADADLSATDPTLAVEPTVIDLQVLIGLPPALPPAAQPTVADAATSAIAPDAATVLAADPASVAASTAAATAAAAASVATAALIAPIVSAPVATAAPAVAAATVPTAATTAATAPGQAQAAAAKLPMAANDAKAQPPAAFANTADSARADHTDDAPEPIAAQSREPVHTGATAGQAARGELLRTGERAPSDGTNSRENNNQGVPSLAFTQVMSNARAASVVAPAAQLQVDTPVGGPGWGTEMGQKVVWMVNEKQQIAQLHVNPPNLGPLDIKLTIDDHQTTAVFTSPHSSVREALESALPRLREVLAESGIMLGNASVTADTPQDGSAFSQPPARNTSAFRGEAQGDSSAAHLTPGAAVTSRGRGLVDLFA